MPDLTGYLFSKTHEWVAPAEGGGVRVGISDFAQAQLGDLVFVELPPVGRRLAAGEKFGVVESVKAANDLYTPVAGRVAEVNAALAEAPEAVNRDPYGSGWMLRLEGADEAGADLLDPAGYEAMVAEQA